MVRSVSVARRRCRVTLPSSDGLPAAIAGLIFSSWPLAFTCRSSFAIVDSNVSSGMRPPNTDESVQRPARRSGPSSRRAVPLTLATT